MNSKTKRRAIAVTAIIVVMMAAILAFVGGSQNAKTVSLADVSAGDLTGSKIQVSGNVVPNSYSVDSSGVLMFSIYDPDDASAGSLQVRYEQGVSATFGNDVVAICTGKVDESGVLQCSELVTKCPSKYENASEALSVTALLDYGDAMVGVTAKVSGAVKAESLASAGSGVRFVLEDGPGSGAALPVAFDGALPDELSEGTSAVVTGALDDSGRFVATAVALAQ